MLASRRVNAHKNRKVLQVAAGEQWLLCSIWDEALTETFTPVVYLLACTDLASKFNSLGLGPVWCSIFLTVTLPPQSKGVAAWIRQTAVPSPKFTFNHISAVQNVLFFLIYQYILYSRCGFR